MDEAAEAIVAFDVCRGTAGEWDGVERDIGRSLIRALVRPGNVVVAHELDQRLLQVSLRARRSPSCNLQTRLRVCWTTQSLVG